MCVCVCICITTEHKYASMHTQRYMYASANLEEPDVCGVTVVDVETLEVGLKHALVEGSWDRAVIS